MKMAKILILLTILSSCTLMSPKIVKDFVDGEAEVIDKIIEDMDSPYVH